MQNAVLIFLAAEASFLDCLNSTGHHKGTEDLTYTEIA